MQYLDGLLFKRKSSKDSLKFYHRERTVINLERPILLSGVDGIYECVRRCRYYNHIIRSVDHLTSKDAAAGLHFCTGWDAFYLTSIENGIAIKMRPY